jgi:uncharacterized damage-inducible protein DinB
MNGSLLDDAFGHHVWATLALLDRCATLTPEQLSSPAPGTFGPIIDTLRHLVGADCSYLALLSGGKVQRLADEATADIARLRAAMEANGPAWAELLAGDLDPAAVVVRHRDDGTGFQAPLTIRLAQVVHHGTDHRSQVCTALTALGVTPPEIDVWDYAGSQGRAFEIPAPAR